jgi:hypothetical protein
LLSKRFLRQLADRGGLVIRADQRPTTISLLYLYRGQKIPVPPTVATQKNAVCINQLGQFRHDKLPGHGAECRNANS